MSEDKTAMNGEQRRYRKECQGQSLEGSGGLTVAAAPMDATGILVGIDTDDQRCLPPTIISSFTGARGKNILCLCPPGIHLPPRVGGRRSLLSCNKGLTLIEIAVVMVLIGILVGLGATMVGPVTQRIKINSTKDYLAAEKEAIIGYFLSRRELPCGATETCNTPDARFNTLARATDAFNSPLYYAYSGNLRTDGASGANVCGILSTPITLRVCHDTSCTASTSIDNVAFVLLSRGENINKQTNGNGSITAATTISVYDPGIDNVPDGDTTDTDSAGTAINRTQKYDDLYTYMTLNELKGKLCSPCSAYEVYNAPGVPIADFRNNITATCYGSVAADTFITSIPNGGSIERHTAGTSCSGFLNTVSYTSASTADTNGNCQVYYNTSGLIDK